MEWDHAEGKVLPGGILKVGSFSNQQIDPALLARRRGDRPPLMPLRRQQDPHY
jgi:hypothetical protein